MPRKRARDETELEDSVILDVKPQDDGTLHKLRNMWQFASFMQYVYFFGKIVKIDEDFDVEDLEAACTQPELSGKLADIGLALLKYVSSHRGLTPDLFDEYTRRQYIAKAPQRNPFGDEEEPKKFKELDVFTKIRILHQLSTWTLGNAERIRAQMDERDSEQTQWRIEPFGWDSDDRTYFLLDDDRLYRCTDPPPPPPPPTKKKQAAKTKKARGTRASKRIKLSTPESDEEDITQVETSIIEAKDEGVVEDDGLGGMKWECLAVTLDEYQDFLESIRRSRDPNEKALHRAVTDTVLPILEKKAEAQRQKALKKQREYENLQKLATAKRSSRIAGKIEKQKEIEEAEAEQRKREEDLKMAHREQERQKHMEEARESRMLTREQRLKDREVRRILHEEEIARLERMQSEESNEARVSERHRKIEMERRQQELKKLQEEEEPWTFDCSVCGVHGENLDDGTHSIACERCNIWQHSKCHGIKEADAEKDEFHFVCADCKKKEEDALKPRIPPLKLGRIGSSSSPQTDHFDAQPHSNGTSHDAAGVLGSRVVDGVTIQRSQTTEASGVASSARHDNIMNGPSLSPHGQSPGPPGYRPNGAAEVGVPQPVWHGTSLPPPPRPTSSSATSPPAYPTFAPNNQHGAPPTHLHYQAHANAVSASDMAHAQGHHTNGFNHGSMAPPSPASQPRYQDAYMGSFNARQGPPASSVNGSSPIKARHQMSPPHASQQSQPLSSPRGSFFPPANSPNASFPPPQQHEYQQRAAGQSPVKQPSPSPQTYQSRPYAMGSPNTLPPAVTPTARGVPVASTPLSNILGQSPQMAASSPIPPIGKGPVIPTKHDTPRPMSRDSIGETPVFPPAMALSPSTAENGKGMSVEGGQGGLGVGNVPVKKMPQQSPRETGGDAFMRDI